MFDARMSPKEEINSIIRQVLEVETRKEEGLETSKNTEALKAIQEEFSKG